MLDAVLRYLDNDEDYQESHEKIKERSKLGYGDKDLQLILDKLCGDGYVSFSHMKSGGKPIDAKTYYISFHGRLFLERGGFQKESKILKRKNNWTIAKTIAAILNAISILAIGVWGVYVSKESKLKDEQIYNLESVIDSLQNQTVTTPVVVNSGTVSKQPDSLNSN